MEGSSLVQDHPLLYSKFEASLGYRRPCLKNNNLIDSSWPEITLEIHKHRTPWLPPLVGLYLLQNSDLQLSHKPSSHLACVMFYQWPVAVCLRASEKGLEVRVSIYSVKASQVHHSSPRGTGQHSGYLPRRASADALKGYFCSSSRYLHVVSRPQPTLPTQPHEVAPAGQGQPLRDMDPWCQRIPVPFEYYIYFLGWLCPQGQSF